MARLGAQTEPVRWEQRLRASSPTGEIVALRTPAWDNVGRRVGWWKPGPVRGFHGFEEFIRSHGGIVTRRELLGAGWTPDELRIAQGNFRRPTRLRRGWYCSSDVPSEVREAWAHGGPLACISALRWYGVIDPGPPQSTLHVCLPRHAKQRRVEAYDPRDVVRHWHGSAHRIESRWAVSLEVAHEQARWCRMAR